MTVMLEVNMYECNDLYPCLMIVSACCRRCFPVAFPTSKCLVSGATVKYIEKTSHHFIRLSAREKLQYRGRYPVKSRGGLARHHMCSPRVKERYQRAGMWEALSQPWYGKKMSEDFAPACYLNVIRYCEDVYSDTALPTMR